MKTRTFIVNLSVSLVASFMALTGVAAAHEESHAANSSTKASRAKSIYYPGYLSQYPYANGSFVYSMTPPAAPPQVVVTPPPIPHASQKNQIPNVVQVSSVASFEPNQSVMSQVLLSGFFVHVGSFLEHSGADGLEAQLREHGIPSFRTPVLLNGVAYVQLHAGPYEDREDAESIRLTIESIMNIRGITLFHGLIPPP